MRTTISPALSRLATAGCLAVVGYVHADLYLNNDYRVIPVVGPAFLLQASGCFAVAVLILLGGPLTVRLLAAGLAVGALVGFVVSRTTGIDGFTEIGLQPAPQALLSLLAEGAVLLLVGVPLIVRIARWMLLVQTGSAPGVD